MVSTGVLEVTRRTKDAEARAVPQSTRHRRTLVTGLIVFAIFATGLGYLVGNQVQSNAQFDRTHGTLTLTRHDIRVVRTDFSSARRGLKAVDYQVRQSAAALSADTAQLHQIQTALTQAETNVSSQGSDITALHACLGGVEQALNALSVGDEQTAVNALTAVSTSCLIALTANG